MFISYVIVNDDPSTSHDKHKTEHILIVLAPFPIPAKITTNLTKPPPPKHTSP